MTRADIKLLIFLVVATVLAVPASSMAGGNATGDAIIYGPSGTTVVSLNSSATYVVEGRIGQVVFEVKDGVLECTSSTCKDKVCVHMGRVSPGHPVVCAPNGISAMLVTGPNGAQDGEFDAVSR